MATSRAQRATTAARRSKAVQMRLAGAQWQHIADTLGYSGRAAACKDVTRALKASLDEQSRNAELLRHTELLRLDRLQTGLWTQAAGGDRQAVETVLKVIDRRVDLLGLKAMPAAAEVGMSLIGTLASGLQAAYPDAMSALARRDDEPGGDDSDDGDGA